MKFIYKIFILVFVIYGITSCEKNENFEILEAQESFKILTPTNGSEITLDDTNASNNALFLSWESSGSDANYTIEVAETGTSFDNLIVLGVSQGNNFSMTVEELNTFLLDVMSLNPEEANSLDFRVTGNGKTSETIAVVFTAYLVEFTEFYLVGSFTAWDATLALAMTNTELNKFNIVVDLVDGDEFKFLPTNTSFDGDWGEDPNNPGNLIVDGEQNISGLTAGQYKISINLIDFTFTTVEIVDSINIAVPGNHQNWDPPTAPLLAASDVTTTDYEGYMWLDGDYKFLAPDVSGNFDWGNTDWGDDGSFTGTLVEIDEVNCNEPTAGYYFVKADTTALTYSTQVTDWGLIGSATPDAWASDQDMTYDSTNSIWTITLNLTAAEIKFRANDDWAINFGDNDADSSLEQDGTNIVVPVVGNYTVVLDLSNPREYTYSLTLN